MAPGPKTTRTTTRFPSLALGAALFALAAAPATGQVAREGPAEAPRIAPQPRGGAGVEAAREEDPLRPTPGRLLPEGAFIHKGRGRMVAGEAGGWVFLFDSADQARVQPPMILQPCIRLSEMRRLAEGKAQEITFSVSGHVFVFEGRNYLLPTFFTTVSTTAPQTPDAEADGDGGDTAPADPDDPQAADLIRSLDALAEPMRGAVPVSAPTDGGAASSLLREGLTIVQKRGRIERGGGGSWVFVTDNGPLGASDGAAPADVPLRLAPCLILQELEQVVHDRGERQVFRISGQVFVYEDRNYLIPTVYQLEPDREGNLTPAQ